MEIQNYVPLSQIINLFVFENPRFSKDENRSFSLDFFQFLIKHIFPTIYSCSIEKRKKDIEEVGQNLSSEELSNQALEHFFLSRSCCGLRQSMSNFRVVRREDDFSWALACLHRAT